MCDEALTSIRLSLEINALMRICACCISCQGYKGTLIKHHTLGCKEALIEDWCIIFLVMLGFCKGFLEISEVGCVLFKLLRLLRKLDDVEHISVKIVIDVLRFKLRFPHLHRPRVLSPLRSCVTCEDAVFIMGDI